MGNKMCEWTHKITSTNNDHQELLWLRIFRNMMGSYEKFPRIGETWEFFPIPYNRTYSLHVNKFTNFRSDAPGNDGTSTQKKGAKFLG